MADLPRITISCSCGKKLAVPMSAAGKKTKCPNCGEVISIPVPRGASAPVARTAVPAPVPTRRSPQSSRPSAAASRPAPARVPSPASAPDRIQRTRSAPPPPPVAIPVEDDQEYGVAFDELADDAAAVGRDGVFHPFDIIFILLAVATAYKVARGGGSDD